MNKPFIFIFILGFFFCFSCGRNKYPADFPKIYPFSVKLIQDGAPLADAGVMFITEDTALQKWAVGGITDANGVAIIYTQGFSGAPQGKYKITISKTLQEGGPSNAEEARQMQEGKEFPPVEIFEMIPQQFKDPNTTPFTVEVPAQKQSSIPEFDLGEGIKQKIQAGS